MKIKAEQLSRNLKNNKLPVIWLSGDEPLLMQEAADATRLHYRDLGYTEREIFVVDKSFNWDHFLQVTGNLSLFSDNKIIELRLTSSRLDDNGKKAIHEYLDDPSPDYLVLVSSPKLEAATMNSKWFKRIESDAIVAQVWPINREGLGNWLAQRLLREGISADADALQLLSDKVEGNLLAAMQEIEKLKLLAKGDGGDSILLDAKTVMQVVADSSRYNAYQLVDATLLADLARAQKILHGLQAEGTFPLVILNAITRELRSLLPMLEKKRQGQGINAIMQTAHVWFNRKQAVGSALQRLSTDDIWKMLEHARVIDQSIKGMSLANTWDELSQLLIMLSGKHIATMEQAAQV